MKPTPEWVLNAVAAVVGIVLLFAIAFLWACVFSPVEMAKALF